MQGRLFSKKQECESECIRKGTTLKASSVGIKTADLLCTDTELAIPSSLHVGGVGLRVYYINVKRRSTVRALHHHWM